MSAPPAGFRIRGLGEIAIRCRDLDAMEAFYGGILGLEPLGDGRRDGILFFRIGPGIAGHTCVLALFASGEVAAGQGALHHIALSLPIDEQAALTRHYDAHGIDWHEQVFDWIGWRGIFSRDPEGNTVEIVAFDPSLGVPPAAP